MSESKMRGIGLGRRGAVYLIVFYALWISRVICLRDYEKSIQSPVTRWAFISCINTLLWATQAYYFVYKERGVSPSQYFRFSVNPKAKIWAISLLSIFIYLSAYVLVENYFFQFRSSNSPYYLNISRMIAAIFVAPFVEEVVFRGIILKEMSIVWGYTISNIVTSLLFVGAHLPYWITSGVHPHQLLIMSSSVFLFSLFSGRLFSFSNSIWPSIVAHSLNNTMANLLIIKW
jgi:uncharacterized protein